MRKVKKRNFILLGILTVGTVFAVFLFDYWYKGQSVLPISSALSEIRQNDFENYLIDNADTLIYFTCGKNSSIRSFEKEFASYIKDNGLTREIVYLNTDLVDQAFYQTLKKYYAPEIDSTVTFNQMPYLLVIKNRKIVEILPLKNGNLKEVIEVLERYEVVE